MLRQIIFKDFVTLQRGFDLPTAQRVDGPYPVVASTTIHGYHIKYKVNPPGVTTGRSGALGEVLYLQQPFWPLNTTLWVKDFKENLPRYVYYFLRAMHLERWDAGTGVPTLNRNHLDNVEITVHDPNNQRKTAAILSAYDDLIENNIRRIRTHEEMAQRIYREWFVKFRFPGHENVKMVDSELGLIPEGWEAKKLGEVIELAYGKSLTADKRRGGQIPVYGSAGIVGYHDSALAKGPGIIVGRKGNVGSIHWSEDDFFAIDTVFFVQTSLSLYYCCFNLRDQNFLNTDAAVPGLNRNQAYRNRFLVPGREVLNSFDRTVAHLFGQIKTLGRKNANLRQTRDLLLPKLISGEADVEDLDIDIGEAPV